MATDIRESINRATRELKGSGIDSPRLEAELLLSKATGWPRPVILIHDYKAVPDEALEKYNELVARRCRREPLQQIVGETEFFGLKILVDNNVMAPRPETEVLVDQVIKRWNPDYRTILDIGTGSGCIAVALAKNLPECSVDAVDISEKALETAGRNIDRHDLDGRVQLIHADLFPDNGKTYDVIVSNPPYIPTAEIERLMPEVSKYEPRLALDGGPDGLGYYRRMAAGLKSIIKTPGMLALEIAQGQAAEVLGLLGKSFKWNALEVAPDLCGVERVVLAQT